MHKSRACDGHLVAASHVERFDSAQEHKGRIRDPASSHHVHSVQSCERVASNMNEIRIDDIVSPRYIDQTRCWKSRTPHAMT